MYSNKLVYKKQRKREKRIMYEPLTRDNAAFLFVDLQVGPLSTVKTMEQEGLKRNALALATVARMHNIPVIFTAGN
jgi:hypothetical protein